MLNHLFFQRQLEKASLSTSFCIFYITLFFFIILKVPYFLNCGKFRLHFKIRKDKSLTILFHNFPEYLENCKIIVINLLKKNVGFLSEIEVNL